MVNSYRDRKERFAVRPEMELGRYKIKKYSAPLSDERIEFQFRGLSIITITYNNEKELIEISVDISRVNNKPVLSVNNERWIKK